MSERIAQLTEVQKSLNPQYAPKKEPQYMTILKQLEQRTQVYEPINAADEDITPTDEVHKAEGSMYKGGEVSGMTQDLVDAGVLQPGDCNFLSDEEITMLHEEMHDGIMDAAQMGHFNEVEGMADDMLADEPMIIEDVMPLKGDIADAGPMYEEIAMDPYEEPVEEAMPTGYIPLKGDVPDMIAGENAQDRQENLSPDGVTHIDDGLGMAQVDEVQMAEEGDKRTIFGRPSTFTGGEWVADEGGDEEEDKSKDERTYREETIQQLMTEDGLSRQEAIQHVDMPEPTGAPGAGLTSEEGALVRRLMDEEGLSYDEAVEHVVAGKEGNVSAMIEEKGDMIDEMLDRGMSPDEIADAIGGEYEAQDRDIMMEGLMDAGFDESQLDNLTDEELKRLHDDEFGMDPAGGGEDELKKN